MVVAYINLFDMYQRICDLDGNLIAAVSMAELPGRLISLSEEVAIVCDLNSVAESVAEQMKKLNPDIKVRLVKNV